METDLGMGHKMCWEGDMFTPVWSVFCSHRWWQGEFNAQSFAELLRPDHPWPVQNMWKRAHVVHHGSSFPFFLDIGLSLYQTRGVEVSAVMGTGIDLAVG